MVEPIPIQKNKRSLTVDPVFTILIPSWNNLAYLQLCVESIRKHSELAHQIIVHVNEGKDGTLAWVESRPDIDYTYSEKNIGVCYALNIARELVAAEYIVYMNDDMYALPGWDRELLNEIRRIGHPFFFLSSTVIEPYFTSHCTILVDYGSDIESFREEKLLNEFAGLPKSDWQGATWPPNVVHRDIWDLAGGYSVEFSPGMYSDPDFSMKLWLIGVRLFKGVAKSRVYHFGSKSVRRVVRNRGYYSFIAKWGMTSSTLSKYYLRRGQPFDGPLGDPRHSISLRWKNLFKRLTAAIRSKSFWAPR